MKTKHGIAVSPGVAIGPAVVLDAEGYEVPKRFVPSTAVGSELQRLQCALDKAREEALASARLFTSKLGDKYGAIFAAHAQMIDDPKLRQDIAGLITEHHYTPEYATSQVMRCYARILEESSPAGAERVSDILDIGKRVLRNLIGEKRQELANLNSPVIVLARDLTPSETAHLDTQHVKALATEAGGRTSHTAIVAGALEIPAVVGLGQFLTQVADGQTVIIDGNQGLVVVDPDEETLAQYHQTEERFRDFEQSLVSLRTLPAETRDGAHITLMGNIEFPSEIDHCRHWGADGIGLYRTEFLYLECQRAPTEEEQFEAYRHVVEAMAGRPVVIRTLDIGADKLVGPSGTAERERNPFLGQRSIRLCLQHLDLFRTQLRAILRASSLGPVRIMFPLVSTLDEFRAAKKVVAQVMEELAEQRVAFDSNVPVGMMMEVPSAVVMADQFARVADFFSVGTNDLTQYTLAVDRNNETVAHLFCPADPAVVRLLRMVIRAASRRSIPLNVCGEMCAEPVYTLLLVGIGVRSMSITPHSIPEVKKVIRSITVAEAVKVASKVMAMQTAAEVDEYLRDQARRILPQAIR